MMIPIVPSLLGALVIAILAFSSGYKIRGDAEKAKQLEVERGWHEKYRQGVAEAQAAAETAGAALRHEVGERTEQLAKLRASMGADRRSGAVRLATCQPAPAVVHVADRTAASTDVVAAGEPDRVLLTPDFRLRYDTALSLVVPASDRAGWVAAADSDAGASLDLWAVLDAHTENADRWAKTREMMTAAQAWFKQMGWVR